MLSGVPKGEVVVGNRVQAGQGQREGLRGAGSPRGNPSLGAGGQSQHTRACELVNQSGGQRIKVGASPLGPSEGWRSPTATRCGLWPWDGEAGAPGEQGQWGRRSKAWEAEVPAGWWLASIPRFPRGTVLERVTGGWELRSRETESPALRATRQPRLRT